MQFVIVVFPDHAHWKRNLVCFNFVLFGSSIYLPRSAVIWFVCL